MRSDIIATIAFELWLADGQPEGRADTHWRMAE